MIKVFGDGRDWFFKKRLGMVYPLGLIRYPSMAEQILWRGHMKQVEYEKLINEFNPINFNPHT